MPKVLIEKLDDFGRGIAHINNKVVFIENALPEEVVEIEIINDKKSFSEAKVTKYLKLSKDRIESKCPYFEVCGGCNLLHLSYENTLTFKRSKIKELLKKNKINYNKEIEIIKNANPYYYRNKVSLKIENGTLGYYEESSHKLIEIKECITAKHSINEVIKNYKLLNLENAKLTIRSNYNNEILIIIETKEKEYNIELAKLKEKVKLVGIVYNNKTIYGENFFYERVGGKLFKVSFDSFFQVNEYITSKLFDLIKNNIDKDSIVLDLYSGVGTLGIIAASASKEVYSIEIIKNAVLNGIKNATLNQVNNIKFMLGDVSKTVDKIDFNFDTLIVDPPRKGLDKKSKEFILKKLPAKIIYVSCDPNTLMRDLKEFESIYEVCDFKIMDMFSYTYHVESFCVLKKKYRKATFNDINDIANLVTDLLGTCNIKSESSILESNIEEITKDINHYNVCTINDKIVGACGISDILKQDRFNLGLKNIKEILYLVVDKKYQGKGIGTQLLKLCSNYNKEDIIYEAWGDNGCEF